MAELPADGTARIGAPPPAAAPGERVPLRMWLGLMALALSAMMHGVDAMVVTVASPTISREMHTGLDQLLWITTGYLLAYAGTLVAAGKLGDRFGHRRVFLIGIVGFVISSVLVGISGNIQMLIAFRILQGVFGASLVPSALAIVRLTFPAGRLKIAIGVFMGTFALSAAAGPFVGGVIVQYAGWRWVFFINVIAGAVTFALTLLLIRPTEPSDDRRSLDVPGIALLAVTLGALVLGVNQASAQGWTGVVPLVCFAAVVVFGALLVLRERSTPEPLLPPELFRSRSLITGSVFLLLASGLVFPIWFYLSLFLQNVQGADALRTGLELLPIPATGIIAAPLGGAVNQKFGARIALTLGVVFGLLTFYGLSRLAVGTGYGSIWPWLVAMGFCMAFTVPVATEVVVSSAAKRLAGVASGVAETMGSLGPALGLASVGTALALVIQSGVAGRLTGAGVPPDVAEQVGERSQSIAQGSVPVPGGTSGSLAGTITRVAHEAYTSGLHTILLVFMIVLILLLPIIWVTRPPAVTDEDEKHDIPTTTTQEEAAR